MNRRRFLAACLCAAGALGLGLLGFGRNVARKTLATFRIPVKPFRPEDLDEPHDLAG
jgi:hypothetical protein